jgi:hypothetical protein
MGIMQDRACPFVGQLKMAEISTGSTVGSTGNSKKVSIKRPSGWNAFYQEVAVCLEFLF